MNIRWINLPDLSRVAKYKDIHITYFMNKNLYEVNLNQTISSSSLEEIIKRIDLFTSSELH